MYSSNPIRIQPSSVLVASLIFFLISYHAYAGEITHYSVVPRADLPNAVGLDFTFSVDDKNGDRIASHDEIFNFGPLNCPICFEIGGIGPEITTLARVEDDVVFGGSSEAFLDLDTLVWTYVEHGVTHDGFGWADASGKGTPVRTFEPTPPFSVLWTTSEIQASSSVHDGLWWNPEESGWGVSLTHQDDIMFLTMFTYQESGVPIWYVASNCVVVNEGCTGELYSVSGASSLTDDWDDTNKEVTTVGSIELAFTDDNNGSINLEIDGVQGAKVVTRQVFAGLTPDTKMTGLWWNPDESGWGVSITRQSDIAFVTLFTYDSGGLPAWYVASSCLVTGTGCSGELYEVTGASSMTQIWNGANIQVTAVGNITFDFHDSDNGTVQFNIDGVNGSNTITRQIFN